MFRCWAENEKKEKIELTQSPYFESVIIDGLIPESATVNTTVLANSHGSKKNNARVNDRSIAITIKPAFPVEENRQRLYKYFQTTKETKLFYKNKNRDVVITGTVENYDGSLFDIKQTITINLLCNEPFFKDKNETTKDMSQVLDLFEFPFSIEEEGMEFSRIEKTMTQNIFNNGDAETGLIIEISASGEVVNPIIYNADTRGYFGLNITMQLGDVIRINTNKAQKRVELVRYGETRNIINNIIKGNDWFQITPGDNLFTYDCESGDEFLNFKFIYANLYEGV